MTGFQAICLAIVEGISEYLPISSTGHMIIANTLLGIPNDEFTKAYIVIIQFGAILSVVALYWRKFLSSFEFYKRLVVGFLPAAVIGFALHKKIDELLESVEVVAWMLLLGGIFFLVMDRLIAGWLKKAGKKAGSADGELVEYSTSLKIGFFQCISMVPGVSRSAATIVGGLFQGLSREKAAEFSFFLAVPTMFGATLLKAAKLYKIIQPEQIHLLIVGNIVAFVVAALAIKGFVGYLQKHSLKYFGYYRIAVGAAILLAIYVFKIDLQLL